MNFSFNKLKHWVVDYVHWAKGATVMYLKHTPPKHYLDYIVEGKSPVIIIPGVFERWAFLNPISDYLSLQGHPVYIVPKLGNNIADIPLSSKKVKEIIIENKLKDVIIVAHSKGGLIAKYLLIHDNEEQRVSGVVAIATPFSGSAIVKFLIHPIYQELGVESEVIKNLDQHKGINNKIVSIFPKYDNHIWHEKGSFLEGALSNIEVPVWGHHKIINDKKVWLEVENAINKIIYLK